MKLLATVAAFLAAVPAASSGFSTQLEAEVQEHRTINSTEPVEMCLAESTSLGSKTPVLALHAVVPERDGWVAIEVTSMLTQEDTVLGLFPSGAFKAETEADARRFFLPPNAGNCFSIKIIGDGSATAEVSLERMDI